MSGQIKKRVDSKTVSVGRKIYFYSIIMPVDAEIENPTWSINNKNVRVVEILNGGKTCRIEGVKVGTTKITFKATINGQEYTAVGEAVVEE